MAVSLKSETKTVWEDPKLSALHAATFKWPFEEKMIKECTRLYNACQQFSTDYIMFPWRSRLCGREVIVLTNGADDLSSVLLWFFTVYLWTDHSIINEVWASCFPYASSETRHKTASCLLALHVKVKMCVSSFNPVTHFDTLRSS